MEFEKLKNILDERSLKYNNIDFIDKDPISIPHQFIKKQDIEIMGFFAAILAWGQRVTIINKCNDLVQLFGNEPHNFMLNHSDNELKSLENFKHRTFNSTDLLYIVSFFKQFYQQNDSLETAFIRGLNADDDNIRNGLIEFDRYFFSLDYAPYRTQKHISSPLRGSACKRINMYLRWMVRKDQSGVDFGIWQNIKMSQLVCPCDVHVERIGRELNLIQGKESGWKMAENLTERLKQFDPLDPVKYDFALFGFGVNEKGGVI